MIKWLYQQIACQLVLFAAFTLCVMPGSNVSAAAYYGNDACCEQPCDPCDPCCESSIWDSKAFIILGSIALGAAAGAAVGAAISHGKHGSSGDLGPDGETGATGTTGTTGTTGPSPFVADIGETLSFDMTLDIGTDIAGPGTVTPYVTQPDGTTIEGPAVVVLATGAVPIPPIVITDPQFGTYTWGVQYSSGLLSATSTTTLSADITASRDGSVTSVIAPPVVFLGSGQAQQSANFVYDPANVP